MNTTAAPAAAFLSLVGDGAETLVKSASFAENGYVSVL